MYPIRCEHCGALLMSRAETKAHEAYRDAHGDCADRLASETPFDRRLRIARDRLGLQGFARKKELERQERLNPPLHLSWKPFAHLGR